jgi:hypothetical protein
MSNNKVCACQSGCDQKQNAQSFALRATVLPGNPEQGSATGNTSDYHQANENISD